MLKSAWSLRWHLSVITLLLVAAYAPGTVTNAQDAVPGEILQRTLYIQTSPNVTGTAFLVDYHDVLYLVTARHVVAGLPTNGATIRVWRDDKWLDYRTTRILFPPSADVDIAVLETGEKPPKRFEIEMAGDVGGATLGQQVWFLGYPYGLKTQGSGLQLPFIKRGTMSAIDSTNKDAVVLYIDGFNNPGFSGGPIVYWDFTSHVYRIFGVVKGFRFENAKTLINNQPTDTNVLANSGILVGYSINHAIQAMDSGKSH